MKFVEVSCSAVCESRCCSQWRVQESLLLLKEGLVVDYYRHFRILFVKSNDFSFAYVPLCDPPMIYGQLC